MRLADLKHNTASGVPAYTCAPHDPAGELGPDGVFRKLKALKNSKPTLKILISVGGAVGSGDFTDAADSANRVAFVKSCIDQFIDGQFASPNEPGIFDGIDLDWEFPKAAKDVANYNLRWPNSASSWTLTNNPSRCAAEALIDIGRRCPERPEDWKLQNILFSGSTGCQLCGLFQRDDLRLCRYLE